MWNGIEHWNAYLSFKVKLVICGPFCAVLVWWWHPMLYYGDKKFMIKWKKDFLSFQPDTDISKIFGRIQISDDIFPLGCQWHSALKKKKPQIFFSKQCVILNEGQKQKVNKHTFGTYFYVALSHLLWHWWKSAQNHALLIANNISACLKRHDKK